MKPSSLRITLGTTQQIRAQSFGEVIRPDTYRQGTPVKGGLYCSQIFGEEADSFEERKNRFGHIELPVPVIHPWFHFAVAACLDLSTPELQDIQEEGSHWITEIIKPDKVKGLRVGERISESELYQYQDKFGEDSFRAISSIEGIQEKLQAVDVSKLYQELQQELAEAYSKAKKEKVSSRLEAIELLYRAGLHPSALLLEALPVMPAIFRPYEPKAKKVKIYEVFRQTEDEEEDDPQAQEEERNLTELYQKVLNRAQRTKRLQALKAPGIIIRNERIVLRDDIRVLFSKIRSLTNPLEKTLDFSGNAVAVVDPGLSLSECGVPIEMALTIWRPFLFERLKSLGLAQSYDEANEYIQEEPDAFDLLQEVMDERPALLFRVPAFEKLSMLSLRPILVRDEALHLHPLLAQLFDLHIDGERLALHTLLSTRAIEERGLTLEENLLSGLTHQFALELSQEALVGLFYLTYQEEKSPQQSFANLEHALFAYRQGQVEVHETIWVRHQKKKFLTTPGRLLLAEVTPKEIPFELINKAQERDSISFLLRYCLDKTAPPQTKKLLAELHQLGVHFATGLSLCIEDFVAPPSKEQTLQAAQASVNKVMDDYCEGMITDGERHNKIIDIWAKALEALQIDGQEQLENSRNNLWLQSKANLKDTSSALSASYGFFILHRDEAGIGEEPETPVVESLREGLGSVSYFCAARKVRRHLLFQEQEREKNQTLQKSILGATRGVRILEKDCKTSGGLELLRPINPEFASFAARITGRTLTRDCLTWEAPLYVTEEIAKAIEDTSVQSIFVRSPLTCEAQEGICEACYGGEPPYQSVGFFASQALRELKGIRLKDDRGDYTLLSRRGGTFCVENAKTVTNRQGERVVISRGALVKILNEERKVVEQHSIPYGARVFLEDNVQVSRQQKLAEWDSNVVSIIAEQAGEAYYEDLVLSITYSDELDFITGLSHRVVRDSTSELRPKIKIREPATRNELACYWLMSGALLVVEDGVSISAGDVIAKLPRGGEAGYIKSSVVALLEAIKPEKGALLAEYDGLISFGRRSYTEGQIIRLTPSFGSEVEYKIPLGQHILVHEGEQVIAGDKLCEGDDDLHEFLRVLGERHVAQYLVQEILGIFEQRGTLLPAQHIELIARQMMQYVQITDVGGSRFQEGDIVTRREFGEENDRLVTKGQTPSIAEPILLGVSEVAKRNAGGLQGLFLDTNEKALAREILGGMRVDLRQPRERIYLGV